MWSGNTIRPSGAMAALLNGPHRGWRFSRSDLDWLFSSVGRVESEVMHSARLVSLQNNLSCFGMQSDGVSANEFAWLPSRRCP